MGLVLPTIKATLLKSICHWVQKSEKKTCRKAYSFNYRGKTRMADFETLVPRGCKYYFPNMVMLYTTGKPLKCREPIALKPKTRRKCKSFKGNKA